MWLWMLVACSSPSAVDLDPVVLGSASPAPQRADWPTEAWPTATPEQVGLDPDALAALEAYAFRRDGDDDDRRGQRTNALVIVRDGKLVVERYARGYARDDALLTWSVSKSMVSTVVGAAVHRGHLHPQDTACTYYAPMCRHPDVRIADLLRMSSGLEWAETYETSPVFSSVMAMLYTRGRADMAAFTASRRAVAAPGTHWVYSSGDSNVVMATLRAALPAGSHDAFPWEAVFDELGMQGVTWEQDAAGTFVGSSYLYARPVDLARWGHLYLNDGVWNGERILAEGWVSFTATMAPAFYTTPVSVEHREDNPGAQWYLNMGDPARDLAPPWPELPADAIGASGHWGKAMWVIPSWDMVVVRMGDDREYGCSYAWQTDCVADRQAAYTKRYFLEMLAAAVGEIPEEVP